MSAYTLPNGINYDGKLYNVITLDELRGRHQNLLVNPSPKTPVDHLEPLLIDLIQDIVTVDSESLLQSVSKRDIVLNLLPIQDIQFIMVKIRETSYGPQYNMELPCPHCGEKSPYKLGLDTLEVIPRKDKISEDKMILPKEGIKFGYTHLSLAKLKKGMFVEGENDITKKIVTETTSYLISHLGDNKNVKSSDFENLKATDINFISDNAPELAEIDTKVINDCSACGKEFTQELPVLAADFLLHTRI